MLSQKIVGILISALIVAPVSAAELPESMSLRYGVEIGGTRIGTLTRTLTRKADVYHVKSSTNMEGLAAVLADDLTESCSFKVVDGKIQPIKYRVMQSGRKTYDRSVIINIQKRIAEYSSGQKIDLPNNYTVDNCSLPFAYLLGGPSVFNKKQMALIGSKKLRRYGRAQKKNEKVKLPRTGSFNTIKITRQRLDKANRSLSFWLAPKYGYLPILIVEKRKSRRTIAKLESISSTPDIQTTTAVSPR